MRITENQLRKVVRKLVKEQIEFGRNHKVGDIVVVDSGLNGYPQPYEILEVRPANHPAGQYGGCVMGTKGTEDEEEFWCNFNSSEIISDNAELDALDMQYM